MPTLRYPHFINPRERRLAAEHLEVDKLCSASEIVDYLIEPRRKAYPPEKYFITFHLRSIIGIDPQSMPLYADKHELEISCPLTYPFDSLPICYMRTPIWHPNIRYDGPFAGKICLLNHHLSQDQFSIRTIVQKIGELIQYKAYHARHIPPYPEDIKVADWVRDFAEPNGIVNKALRIYTDYQQISSPARQWINSRKNRNHQINIK